MSRTNRNLGQYFTPEKIVKFMCGLITKPITADILEPCAGKGAFLKILNSIGYTNIEAYEIDTSLENESNVPIKNKDFLLAKLDKKYDLIIGNPPYVRWKNIPVEIKENLLGNSYWTDVINGLSDLLYAFIYRCIDLLKEDGELIFITPSYWIDTLHSTIIRRKVIENGIIDSLINFGEMGIFEGVRSSIIIFKFIKRKKSIPISVINVNQKQKLTNSLLNEINLNLALLKDDIYVKTNSLEGFVCDQFSNGGPWNILSRDIFAYVKRIEDSCTKYSPQIEVDINRNKMSYNLNEMYKKTDLVFFNNDKHKLTKIRWQNSTYFVLKKDLELAKDNLKKRYTNLGDIAEIGNGMVSGLDTAFKLKLKSNLTKQEREKTIKVIKAKGLRKYFHVEENDYIFVNDISTEMNLRKLYPNIYKILFEHKLKLESRYDYNRDIPWWHWVFLRNKNLIENNNEKIFVPCKERFSNKNYVRFSLVKGNFYASQDTTVIVKKPYFKESIKYILAILNSKITFDWLKNKGLKRGGVLEFSEQPLTIIPIKLIDWNDKKEAMLHDAIVDLIDNILTSKDYSKLENEIEFLIKELYDL